MLEDVVRAQEGIVTRAQAIAAGLSPAKLTHLLARGEWQRVFLGVYATFSGPLPRRGLLWAAVLRAGPGAVLSHDTAAELAGLIEPPKRMAMRPPPSIHVTVPAARTPARIPGVVLHRSRAVARARHPTRMPTQTRIEETVVDLIQAAPRLDDALAWLARAVGSRLTTVDRLLAAIRDRPRVRSRRLLLAALADVATGAHSLAELTYLRRVERAHGLPRSQRQFRRATGPTRYDDVRYVEFGLRVEVDGRAAHPIHDRWRDMHRDNDAVVDGDRVLRFGFADIHSRPCAVAAQVATVLGRSGWPGAANRCRLHDCVVA